MSECGPGVAVRRQICGAVLSSLLRERRARLCPEQPGTALSWKTEEPPTAESEQTIKHRNGLNRPNGDGVFFFFSVLQKCSQKRAKKACRKGALFREKEGGEEEETEEEEKEGNEEEC